MRTDVERQLPSGSYSAFDMPAPETGHTECERAITEMDSQERQDFMPDAEDENNALACSDSGAATPMSGNAPEWPGTSACEASGPGGRVTASSTELDAIVPVRTYFPLWFGPTSSPFSRAETFGAHPSQVSHGKYPPARNSLQRDCRSENVFEPARDESWAHISVIPHDFRQPSSREYQSFFVTLPVRQGVSMCNYAPTAAATVATRARQNPEMATDIIATAAVAPTQKKRDESPGPRLTVPTGATQRTPADIHAHSLPGPHIKYRVHCGQVWAIGLRHHFLVETEPVESSLHGSHLPDPSLMTASGYTGGGFDICPEELKRNMLRYRRRRQRKSDKRQWQRRCSFERPKPKEALFGALTQCGLASDLDGNDINGLPEDEEQSGTTARNQNCFQANEELRRLHKLRNSRARVQSPAACAEGTELLGRDAVEVVAPQAGRFHGEGAYTSHSFDIRSSPPKIHSFLADAHPVPTAASESPDLTSVTVGPSQLPYPDAMFHENSVTFGVPTALSKECCGASDSASPTPSNIYAAQMAAQTSIHNGAALSLGVPEDPLRHLVDTYKNVDKPEAKGRGLRECRPPPLDPESVIQGPDVMALIFVPSPYSLTPSSTIPFYASDDAPPTTGQQNNMHINNLEWSLIPSDQVHATENPKRQQRVTGCIPCPSVSPFAIPTSFPVTPPNAPANGFDDGLEAGSAFFRFREESLRERFPGRSVLDNAMNHEGFNGCSSADRPTSAVGDKQAHDSKNEQANQQGQQESARIQDPCDSGLVPARGVAYDQKGGISKRLATGDAYSARRFSAKNVGKHARVRGLTAADYAGRSSDMFSNRHTVTSPLPKRLRVSEILINDIETEIHTLEDIWRLQRLRSSLAQETEIRTPEDFCKSQRSLLPVEDKTEVSTATSSETGSYGALSDLHADDCTDDGANTQHDDPGEDSQETAFVLSSSSNCKTKKFCIEYEFPQHEECCCRDATSIPDGQEGNRHVKRHQRRTSTPAQAYSILATTSSLPFGDKVTKFCSGGVEKSNENADRETTTMPSSQCTLAGRRFVCAGDTGRSEVLRSGVREGASRAQEKPRSMVFRRNRYSSRRPSLTSLRSSAAVSAGGDLIYSAVSEKHFTDAVPALNPEVSQERAVSNDLMLHNLSDFASNAQSVEMYSPTCFSPHHCHVPALPSLETRPEAIMDDGIVFCLLVSAFPALARH